MGLTFEEKQHRYKLDGVPIPSVTQAIEEAGLTDLRFISKELLKEKGDLGTKVHTTTEFHDMGILNLKELHPVLKGYLDSWIKFRNDFEFVPIDIELMLSHPLYRYAGKVDRIGTMNNSGLTIVDIKSGTKQKAHAIQTAGYKELYDYGKKKKEQIKKRIAVYISPEGYKVEPYDDPHDKNVFLSCLTICNYKKYHK